MQGGGAVTAVLLVVLLGQYVAVYLLSWRGFDEGAGTHTHASGEGSNEESVGASLLDWGGGEEGGGHADGRRVDLRRKLLVSDVHVGRLMAILYDGGAGTGGTAALEASKSTPHGEYSVLPQVIKASGMPETQAAANLVTICTHSSLDNVKAVRHQAHAFRQQGPVSLAVFVDQDMAVALATVARLALCADLSNVDVHIVFARKQVTAYRLDFDAAVEVLTMDCADLLSGKDQPTSNYETRLPYPNNALRNIARQYATTDYIAVLDVDIVPSATLAEAFKTALSSVPSDRVETTAFVLPAFEVSSVLPQSEFPKTRQDMLGALRSGQAQPFYKDVCWKCQRQTRYDIWQREVNEPTYEVPWTDPWEPFYIARSASCPSYDERFKQYGFNRISQVCETHIAGFSFQVMYNAFVMHAGFKVPDAFHSSKQAELSSNRMLFRRFKQELKSKYPGVSRRCY